MEYKKRIADQILKDKLEAKGAVLIRGPKWCGKTTTAEQQAQSVIYINDPAHRLQYQEMGRLNPAFLLKGAVPRLIDEWQNIPLLWDAVRFEVDQRRSVGQFILTGSAVPMKKEDREQIYHTGAGRFGIIDMAPMTLFESGDSTGEVSLTELFHSPSAIEGFTEKTLQDIAYLACRGGWPFAVNPTLSENAALAQANEYLDVVVEEDISRVDEVQRNPNLARRIMRSYARNQGAQISVAMIRKDVASSETDTLSDNTVYSYLNALRQIFVIKDLEAWNPNLNSKTAIRTSPTRYFIDPSIATAAMRIGPDDLMNSLFTFGFIFEALCVRDLRVFAEILDGDLYHYRDSNGLECDAVLHRRNGQYGLIEIKLGSDPAIEEGAKNLLKLSSIINKEKMGPPSFLMVLTAVGPYAYRRSDNVYVVPITCLKP